MLRPYTDRPTVGHSSAAPPPACHAAAARQRGVHDPTRPRPKGDMGNPVPVREAQQIARLVARARGVDLHLPAHEQLQVRVSRERDPPGRVGSLDQGTYAARGIALPRDSDLQLLVGREVKIDAAGSGYEAGDLLCFADGHRVSHVALWAGAGRIVHSALARGGCVTCWWRCGA